MKQMLSEGSSFFLEIVLFCTERIVKKKQRVALLYIRRMAWCGMKQTLGVGCPFFLHRGEVTMVLKNTWRVYPSGELCSFAQKEAVQVLDETKYLNKGPSASGICIFCTDTIARKFSMLLWMKRNTSSILGIRCKRVLFLALGLDETKYLGIGVPLARKLSSKEITTALMNTS